MEIFEMQKEFDELMKKGQELIKKMKEKQVVDDSKKVERWRPKDGDRVWFINDNGDLEDTTYLEGCDELSFKLGNRFKTEAEALKELDRRIAESELLDLADGSVNDNTWFEIEYTPYDDCFTYGQYSTVTSSCYRFASKESCNKAMKQLGKERLKLIFRID